MPEIVEHPEQPRGMKAALVVVEDDVDVLVDAALPNSSASLRRAAARQGRARSGRSRRRPRWSAPGIWPAS